jgi:hypothetical protein
MDLWVLSCQVWDLQQQPADYKHSETPVTINKETGIHIENADRILKILRIVMRDRENESNGGGMAQ